MSLEAMVWAVSGDAPVADVNEFAVLGCMADKADHDGCGTWQSKETIAQRTHVSEETVKRCWRNMLKRGLIAKGDQDLVKHYRADKRPVVYDLLIPYTWFSNIDRINAERERLGRPPLTPENRPPIAPAPAKTPRADKGKPRPPKARGNSKTPRESTPKPRHGGTTSRPRGNYKSSTGELVDPQTGTSNHSLNHNPIPPSVLDVQVPDAIGSGTDGRTDGGGVIEGQEQQPVRAGVAGAAAADAAPELRGNRAGGAVAVVPVELTPGVEVLRAVAAEAPEWQITHAKTLQDQGDVATAMLAEGITPQAIRHALVSVPLPQPVRTSVGAIVGRRLADLRAIGPAAGIRPIPAQQSGVRDVVGGEPTPTPPSLAERLATLDAAVSGQDRHRWCAGDGGLCARLALPGLELCAVCLGGEKPVCQNGCGRGVVAPGARCLVCDGATSAPPETPGTGPGADTCPGTGGDVCGRAVQTAGLCGRCRIKAEKAKLAADAEWEQARAVAVAASEAEDAAHSATV
ncbi:MULTISPECIES: hypothetical protein [unclassified Streptomyces]|uniref:hypothetical protein n=1 Tax=unclassified Streptomyces TaxID=2593676 RepID=UPI003815EE13